MILNQLIQSRVPGFRLSDSQPCSFVPVQQVVPELFPNAESVLQTLKHIYGENASTELAARIYEWAPKLFCILLYIGKEHMIERLLSRGTTDDDLPYSAETSFLADLPGRDCIWDKFFREQWVFLVKPMSSIYQHNLSPASILPFSSFQPISMGAISTVHQLAVHANYDDLNTSTIGLRSVSDEVP